MARAQETALARFYGLPKVHKEGAPLRPIVSLKGTPTYGLARWLFRRLKFLTADSDTTVCSSTQFLEKLKGDLAIETVQLLLRNKYDETENRLGHAQVLQLLKFCLRTYFTFDGTIYEQVKGTPMGSPISGFIAEAVLQRLESLVFQHHRPKFWTLYVDDTFVVIERDQVLTFKERLNSVFPDIQFTMEEEENNQLAAASDEGAAGTRLPYLAVFGEAGLAANIDVHLVAHQSPNDERRALLRPVAPWISINRTNLRGYQRNRLKKLRRQLRDPSTSSLSVHLRITEIFEMASRMRQARDRQRESIALSGSNPGNSVANIFRYRSSSKRGHELPPLLNDNKVFLTDDTDKAELHSSSASNNPVGILAVVCLNCSLESDTRRWQRNFLRLIPVAVELLPHQLIVASTFSLLTAVAATIRDLETSSPLVRYLIPRRRPSSHSLWRHPLSTASIRLFVAHLIRWSTTGKLVTARAHLDSEEHKARIESAAHSANEPVAEQRTKAATCQACGLDFNTVIELKAHLATPEHVARVEHVTQQGKPVSPSPRHLRCMCCDMTFLAKSELRRHLASDEHVQRAEKMRLSDDGLPCKSSATVSNTNDNNACDNKIQLEQNHPPSLAPQTFHSPVTPTGSASIPSVNSERVGACKVCGLVFYVSADLKVHLASEEHKARIESTSRSTNEPLATKRTKVASCQACAVDFHVTADLTAHLASSEHAARVNNAVQQEAPVPISRGLLRCMCCGMTFLAKSELQQHLTTQEHMQKAERMRQSDDKLLCKSYAAAEATASDINSNNALDGEVQLEVNLPQALPGNEELTTLVKHLCEEMRPFIRSEICRLLEPIFAP
nr:unnamed protein product [Spirometra erinaceieuropaei]